MCMINHEMSYTGMVEIKVVNQKDGKITEETINNMIMNGIYSDIIKVLQGITPDLRIKFLAIGNSSVAVTGNETQLVNEVFRTPITTSSNPSNGVLYTTFTIQSTEFTGQIEEIGFVCGTNATPTANTGRLLARLLWSHEKTADETLSFRRRDLIQ